jgi:hypothetical protein
MRPIPRFLLSFLPVILLGVCGRVALAAPRPRVLILNAVDLPPNLAEVRSRLSEALGSAVTERGYELLPATPSACIDHDCLKSLAASVGATDILVASGARNELLGYRIDLRLWAAAADREDHSSPECNACSASQMVDNVARAAGPLLDRLPALHATSQPPSVAVLPSGPVEAVSMVPSSGLPTSTGPSPAQLALGFSLIGIGAAAGATGIVLWLRDGETTDCVDQRCAKKYETRTAGIVLTAAGVVGAGLGAVVLLLLPRHQSTTIVLSPTGFRIAGTY